MGNLDCRTELLADEPIDQDELRAQPHTRVAEAIAQMILKEEGKKAVALEGPWGSGKSTTIRLLEGKLSGDKGPEDCAFFVFDAWAHRRDPLKRAFIDELVTYLDRKRWLAKRKSRDALDSLRTEREETKTRTEPQLADAAILVWVLSLLLPIGIAVLGAAASAKSAFLYGLATLLLAAAVYLIAVTVYNTKSRRQLGHVFGVVLRQATTTSESITVRTPEPTSIEFREMFDKIVELTLSKHPDRRFVVVIDNLDRVDPGEALTIWATMRNFFEFNVQSAKDCLRHFWLIVPYDRGSLERLWGAEMMTDMPIDEDGEDSEVDGTQARRAAGNRMESQGGPAAAFIDKSFQVRFQVPTPVASDRRALFYSLYDQAFPDHEKERPELRYATYRIFDLTRPVPGSAATPRDIKVFLNEVGAFHRQWPDKEMPPDLEALYVAKRHEIDSPEAIKQKGLVGDHLAAILSEPSWQKYFAALYFNVPPKTAVQVLIGETVETALREGDPELLRDQASVPGFGDICARTIEERIWDWLGEDPAALPRAAAAVAEVTENIPPEPARGIWRGLLNGIRRKPKRWPGLDARSGRGLGLLLGRETPERASALGQALTAAISDSLPARPAEGPRGDELRPWVEGAVAFLEVAPPTPDNSARPLSIVVPEDAATYMAVLRLLRDLDVDLSLRMRFTTELSAADLSGHVSSKIQQGEMTDRDVEDFSVLPTIKEDWSWEGVSSALVGRIRASSALDPPEAIGLCRLLEHLAKTGAVPENEMNQLLTQGPLITLLGEMNAKNDDRARAACLLPLFLENPAGNLPGGGGRTQQGRNYYDAVKRDPSAEEKAVLRLAELIGEQDEVERLIIEEAYRTEAPNLTAYLLQNRLRLEPGGGHVTATTVAEEFDYLRSVLGDESMRELVRGYWAAGALQNEMETLALDQETAPRHLFVFRAVRGDQAKDYGRYLAGELERIDKETWRSSIRSGNALVELMQLLAVDKSVILQEKWKFVEGLDGYVEDVVNGRAPVSEPQIVSTLAEALDDEARQNFLEGVVEAMIGAPSGKRCAEVVAAVGDALLDNSDLLVDKADRVVTRVLVRLVEAGDDDAISWVSDVMNAEPHLFEQASKPTRERFRAVLREVCQNVDEDSNVLPLLHELAKL